MTTLIKIHRQLSRVMRIAVWYFICARELFSRSGCFIAIVKFSLCQDENVRKRLAHFRLRRSRRGEIRWNPQVQRRTNKIFDSERPWVYFNHEEWLKELEDTSPANEAEGHITTSNGRTKLLENGRSSKTSTTRESSTDVDIDLEISSFWLSFPSHGFKTCLEKKKKPKLKQHNTTGADEIF